MVLGSMPSASAAAAAQVAFCALWRPRSAAGAGQPRDFRRGAAGRLQDAVAVDIHAVSERLAHRHADHALTGLLGAVGDAAAPAVVDADHRGAARAAHR